MKCDKHDITLVPKDIGHGKTDYICPECDREKHMRLERIYAEAKTRCPLCGQEMPK